MKMRQLIRGIVAVASPIPTCYFFSACFALPLVLMNEFFNYSPPDRSEWLLLPPVCGCGQSFRRISSVW